jgi:hypothetical protein
MKRNKKIKKWSIIKLQANKFGGASIFLLQLDTRPTWTLSSHEPPRGCVSPLYMTNILPAWIPKVLQVYFAYFPLFILLTSFCLFCLLPSVYFSYFLLFILLTSFCLFFLLPSVYFAYFPLFILLTSLCLFCLLPSLFCLLPSVSSN